MVLVSRDTLRGRVTLVSHDTRGVAVHGDTSSVMVCSRRLVLTFIQLVQLYAVRTLKLVVEFLDMPQVTGTAHYQPRLSSRSPHRCRTYGSGLPQRLARRTEGAGDARKQRVSEGGNDHSKSVVA